MYLRDVYKDYINTNNSNSYQKHNYLFNILNQLIIIYGVNNVNKLLIGDNNESFKECLSIYGYPKENIDLFLELIDQFYLEFYNKEINSRNELFFNIQKMVIDMMKCKLNKENISSKELNEFRKNLYTKEANKLLQRIFNLLFFPEPSDVEKYYESVIEAKPIEVEKSIPKLPSQQYELYGFSMDEINSKSNLEIEKINKIILDDINSSSEESGGREQDKPKRLILTSGNAVVDAILLLAVVATQLFVGLLIVIEIGKR